MDTGKIHKERSRTFNNNRNSEKQVEAAHKKGNSNDTFKESGRLKARLQASVAGLQELTFLRKTHEALVEHAKNNIQSPTIKERQISKISQVKSENQPRQLDCSETEHIKPNTSHKSRNRNRSITPNHSNFNEKTIGNESNFNFSCNESSVRRSPSPAISERFTQPAKISNTDASYNYPSPMHAVLIQYGNVPRKSDMDSNDKFKSGDRTAQKLLIKSEQNIEVNDEASTTRYIQKMVRRSSSFKKFKDIEDRKENTKALTSAETDKKSSKYITEIQRFIRPEKRCNTTSPLRTTKSQEGYNKDIEIVNNKQMMPRGRQVQRRQVPKTRALWTTRSNSASRISMTSSDGGYFSYPNSPKGSLKFGEMSKQNINSKMTHGASSCKTRSQTPDPGLRRKLWGNLGYDGGTGPCQRSQSFSGNNNLPFSIFQQRPRSLSAASSIKPVLKRNRKINSFSSIESSTKHDRVTKLTLSISACMNDVQDTFI